MVQRYLLIAAMFALAGACEKVKRPGSDEGVASAQVQCSVRVDNLSRRIAKPGRHRHQVEIPHRMLNQIPISAKAQPLDGLGPELAIVSGHIEFTGQRIADIDNALRQRLAAEAQLYELNREFLPDPTRVPPVYIWTDGDTPAATIAKILAVMPELYQPRLLVYGARDTDSYAPPSDAPEAVRAFWKEVNAEDDPRERTLLIEDSLTRAIGRCQPLVDLYGNLATIEGTARLNQILNDSPRAVRDCKCQNMDVDLYEATILAMLDAHRQRQRWIPLVFVDDAPVTITLDARATVDDLVAGHDDLTNVQRAGKLGLRIETEADSATDHNTSDNTSNKTSGEISGNTSGDSGTGG